MKNERLKISLNLGFLSTPKVYCNVKPLIEEGSGTFLKSAPKISPQLGASHRLIDNISKLGITLAFHNHLCRKQG
ncbi:hypothetical protein [Lysinibacillus sp. 3P01SB]|uniref:hypothetical protein n=1 Tax=Lysinibacillus sp. 3P01SB TaxID=3132284 RepID=UPI0039A73D59